MLREPSLPAPYCIARRPPSSAQALARVLVASLNRYVSG